MLVRCGLTLLALLVLSSPAEAKKFRYSEGPKPSADTTLTSAQVEMEPSVSPNGPKLPPTNLQLISMVADQAISRAMKTVPIDSGSHVTIAPAESHPLNFVVEHALLHELSRRGVSATVRHSLVPDDSLSTLAAIDRDPLLEYQLASARIAYLRLEGGYILPSRTKVERQGLVEGGLVMRDPASARVLWSADASANLVDRVQRSQIKLVEDERFTDLKGEIPERNLGRYVEPLVVIAVVTGLVVLFFQNRP
ncbi:MAG TPA: hypothetical protein VMJ70_07690 [Candidatus Sulfotelmatobacter sp.]|nr:hypothetical protein [Candidatus Sulfotelmatobacter sp.]